MPIFKPLIVYTIMDKINLLVKTLLVVALLVPLVPATQINSSNSIANASTNNTETTSSLPSSNSSSLPFASLVNETGTSSNNNNSFVYASPTVQFKNLLGGVDKSCYKVPLYDL